MKITVNRLLLRLYLANKSSAVGNKISIMTRNYFLYSWLGSILLYIVLTTISMLFEVYKVFPAYGMLGYTCVILLLLFAVSMAEQRWHYIVAGLTLVLAGVVASIDIVLSRDIITAGLRALESDWAKNIFTNNETVKNLVNVLVILLNVFTTSLAAGVLFYG